MFQWNEEMIAFMRDASEYSSYHRHLARWMLPDLHPEDHICDAGCGLGYLSLALAPHVRRVTAADRSEAALSVLRENCTARGIGNIDILPGDLLRSAPSQAVYDAMVFCFFGRMEEIVSIARRQCRGPVFVFKKNYVSHRFSVESHPTGGSGFSTGRSWLAEQGIPFTADTLELELGQPFRSPEAARRFFLLYTRDEDPSLITDDFLRSRLVQTGQPDFPLYMPHKRPIGCIKFSAEDLK